MKNPPRSFTPINFKVRLPALDGIRALAVTLVFMEHYGGGSHGSRLLNVVNQLRLHAGVGVDLFFVLSGFLITGILFDTTNDSRYFSRFFLRRSVRIFPVFYLVVFLILVLTPFLHYQLRFGQLSFLFYLGNFFANRDFSLYTIYSATHPTFKVNIAHFWSLCVEEQFYMVWPFVVWFVRDRVKLIWVGSGIIAVALALRLLLYFLISPGTASLWSWRSLPFRADTLIVGAILALLLRGPSADRWQRLCLPLFWISSILVAAIFVFSPAVDSLYLTSIGLPLIALASAGLIGMTLRTGSFAFRLFYLKPLRVLGKYSYGFYIYHVLFATAWIQLLVILIGRLHSLLLAGILALSINFLVTFIVSKYSYELFEVRFLKLKKHFEYDSEVKDHQHAFITR